MAASCSGFSYVYCFLILQDKLFLQEIVGVRFQSLCFMQLHGPAPILPLSCVFWGAFFDQITTMEIPACTFSGSPFVYVPSTIVHVWAIWELHWWSLMYIHSTYISYMLQNWFMVKFTWILIWSLFVGSRARCFALRFTIMVSVSLGVPGRGQLLVERSLTHLKADSGPKWPCMSLSIHITHSKTEGYLNPNSLQRTVWV